MIYVFLAEGFEEIEALTPVDLMRRAGLEVKTVGIGESKRIKGSHGIVVEADLTEQEISKDNLKAVVLPGGLPGTLNLEHADAVQNIIDYCYEKGILIAAICAAPSILGHKGLLKGKTATAFPRFQQELEGAVIGESGVCFDGGIVTAKGMGVSTQFGLKLVEILVSKEKAEEIRDSIQWETK